MIFCFYKPTNDTLQHAWEIAAELRNWHDSLTDWISKADANLEAVENRMPQLLNSTRHEQENYRPAANRPDEGAILQAIDMHEYLQNQRRQLTLSVVAPYSKTVIQMLNRKWDTISMVLLAQFPKIPRCHVTARSALRDSYRAVLSKWAQVSILFFD